MLVPARDVRFQECRLGTLSMLCVYFPFIDLILKDALREDHEGVSGGNIARLREHLYGRDGLLCSVAPAFLRYFRPGFHPWEYGNSALLTEMESITWTHGPALVA